VLAELAAALRAGVGERGLPLRLTIGCDQLSTIAAPSFPRETTDRTVPCSTPSTTDHVAALPNTNSLWFRRLRFTHTHSSSWRDFTSGFTQGPRQLVVDLHFATSHRAWHFTP
jgi:hypothetical protein